MVRVPKSGRPLRGQIEVYSGIVMAISYEGNWFGHVSMVGSGEVMPLSACLSV